MDLVQNSNVLYVETQLGRITRAAFLQSKPTPNPTKLSRCAHPKFAVVSMAEGGSSSMLHVGAPTTMAMPLRFRELPQLPCARGRSLVLCFLKQLFCDGHAYIRSEDTILAPYSARCKSLVVQTPARFPHRKVLPVPHVRS